VPLFEENMVAKILFCLENRGEFIEVFIAKAVENGLEKFILGLLD
jgi:hypothetical protein